MSSRPADGSLKTITFVLIGIAWSTVATADPPSAPKGPARCGSQCRFQIGRRAAD
jgi:hypothetical protein